MTEQLSGLAREWRLALSRATVAQLTIVPVALALSWLVVCYALLCCDLYGEAPR